MAPTLKQLRKMSDEEIEQAHDSLSERTILGVSYFLDELSRRAFERASAAALEEARAARKLAIVNGVVAVVAVVVAVAAIVTQVVMAG